MALVIGNRGEGRPYEVSAAQRREVLSLVRRKFAPGQQRKEAWAYVHRCFYLHELEQFTERIAQRPDVESAPYRPGRSGQ